MTLVIVKKPHMDDETLKFHDRSMPYFIKSNNMLKQYKELGLVREATKEEIKLNKAGKLKSLTLKQLRQREQKPVTQTKT